MKKKQKKTTCKKAWISRGMKTALAVVLAGQMFFGNAVSVLAEDTVSEEGSAEAESTAVLDSAWEVENPTDGNLKVNDDGSITIRTEGGTIDSSMNNVLYYQLPNNTDYEFTVKVSGEFTANYQGHI